MKALLTGCGGQDGSYLCELLLSKGYEVHGIIRRSSAFNTSRIDHILDKLTLHYGDVTDGSRMVELVRQIDPDEIYHLACLSHVKNSFIEPLFSAETISDGTLNMLEALRQSGGRAKFYNASSSEMFGNAYPGFQPISPYGATKLYAYHMAELYRSAYGFFIVNGILFNHESPRRGVTFVSRKITHGIGRILAGKQDKIVLGNLQASRDWGYAPEYVKAMWLLLQQKVPRYCEVSTGETHTVGEFVEAAFNYAGLDWRKHVEISEKFTRPNELHKLRGDPGMCEWLGWKPKVRFHELVQIMVDADRKENKP